MNLIPPPLTARFSQFWQQRSASEQRALRLLALVIVLAASAQTLWQLHALRERLQGQLPGLAEQAAQARALAGDADRQPKTALASTASARPAAIAQVQAVAETLGGELSIRPGENTIRLQGEVDTGRWLRWLALLETQQRWQLVRLAATRTMGNTLNIDAELRPANAAP